MNHRDTEEKEERDREIEIERFFLAA